MRHRLPVPVAVVYDRTGVTAIYMDAPTPCECRVFRTRPPYRECTERAIENVMETVLQVDFTLLP